MTRKKIGVAVIGFGWMGQAHTRSYLRIPTLFPERDYDPELIIISDNLQERVDEAVESFGFREGTTDWNVAVNHPDVDVVCVCAPNMLHEPIAIAARQPESTCSVRSRSAGRPSRRCASKPLRGPQV